MKVAHAVTDGILSLPGLETSNVRDLHGAATQFATQPLIQALNGEALDQEEALVESTGPSGAISAAPSASATSAQPLQG